LSQLVDRPCVGATSSKSYLFKFRLCVKTMCCIKRDVRYTIMILPVICRLMCATVPRAHIMYIHSILSLKWSVTLWNSLEELYGRSTGPYSIVRFLLSLHLLPHPRKSMAKWMTNWWVLKRQLFRLRMEEGT
jgi:hypothetical protein